MIHSYGTIHSYAAKPSADFLSQLYMNCSAEEQSTEDISNLLKRLSPTSEAKSFNELLGLLKINGQYVKNCKDFAFNYLQERNESPSNDEGPFHTKGIHSPEISKNKVCFLIEDKKIPYWVEITNLTCGNPAVKRHLLAYQK